MIQIPYLSTARFSGEQAGQFLQSQLSADIGGLAAGEATFACYCTPKGQVLGLWRVQRQEDEFIVAAKRQLLPAMLQRLRMFVFRTRVRFEEDADTAVFGAGGGDYLFGPAGEGSPADAATWKAAELRRGVVWLDELSSEKHIPQMLGFDSLGAVSFSKGCYPGQEIVARARYLGKVKRKPLLLEVEGEVTAVAGEKIGLDRGDEAVLVDLAFDAGNTVLFTVARDGEKSEIGEVTVSGRAYRCATT
jgi:folate-binding protein YgfZ